jgi:hypothetical protein
MRPVTDREQGYLTAGSKKSQVRKKSTKDEMIAIEEMSGKERACSR